MFNALDLLRNYQDSASEREARRRLSELAEQKFAAQQQAMPGELEGQRLSNLAKRVAIENVGPEIARKERLAQAELGLKRDAIASRERTMAGALAARAGKGPAAPAGYRFRADGNLEAIPGGPATADKTKPATDVENVAAGYATRMAKSGALLDALEERGIGKPEVLETMGSMGVGRLGKVAANLGASADRQKYRQAQEDWVRAKLRKESGAVIGAEEMDQEIRTYFPQIGDEPGTVKQKSGARKTAEASMRQAAGRAHVEGPSAPAQQRQVVRTGRTADGKKVVQYSDGSIEEVR